MYRTYQTVITILAQIRPYLPCCAYNHIDFMMRPVWSHEPVRGDLLNCSLDNVGLLLGQSFKEPYVKLVRPSLWALIWEDLPFPGVGRRHPTLKFCGMRISISCLFPFSFRVISFREYWVVISAQSLQPIHRHMLTSLASFAAGVPLRRNLKRTLSSDSIALQYLK
jgi:hypothetical protein